MFNLNTNRKLYELIWFDGTVLHCRKPSQSFLLKIAQFQKDIDGISTEEAIIMLNEIVFTIVNSNVEGIEYTQEDIDKDMDIEIATMLIQDYFENINNELGE